MFYLDCKIGEILIVWRQHSFQIIAQISHFANDAIINTYIFLNQNDLSYNKFK